ncbi:MAG: glycosyltransferase [Caulobacteraceae bacterium]|nr:glycosyltransferase [Caulobacteraceae bacterium]
MNLKEQVFVDPRKLIDSQTQIVFVADLFANDYSGGAELTTEALVEEAPFIVQKIHSKDVNLSALSQGKDKFWVFGNFAQLNPELIPSIVANLKYAILEYDYKYCKFRSPEKHTAATGSPCDCHEQMTGKLVSAFYYGATSLWWMSEGQKQRYHSLFPFLAEKDNVVLSSVFSKKTLGLLKWLRGQAETSSTPRQGWIVLGSQSWVKGFEAAKAWCEAEGKKYEVVWDLPYDQVLEKMAHAEGFVYLPAGADTCPRMVIEAKLLGCKMHLNDNVQHASEEWFATDNLDDIHDYLFSAPGLFWKGIRAIMEYKPSISGYTTTYNCVSQGYPFEVSIRSMLQFCSEVCVVDGGSTDGTLEKLQALADESSGKVKVKRVERDWNHPRFAVFDGMQKAEARKMCTGDFCWQMDSDEIVHEIDATKIVDLAAKMPTGADIISLPVIEYWGGPEKVRCDIQPWKWRLSRNAPHITHGIPKELRKTDSEGNLYALEGTDGCDMIHSATGERLPHVTFHNQDAENARQAALQGNADALRAYSEWFNNVVDNIPGVHHYSWYNMPRKIKTYKGYWTKHWLSLYDKKVEDTAENNMFFDVPWSEVTDEMIEKRAEEIKQGTGGWIWHRKWKGQRLPHIEVKRGEPKLS